MNLQELEAYHEDLLRRSEDSDDYYARLLAVQLEIEKKKLIQQWS